jgi:hypothetical protein
LLIATWRSLPPLLCARGVSPSQAANWRPERNRLGSGVLAAIVLAVIGPIPGMLARPQLVSSSPRQAMMRFSRRSIQRQTLRVGGKAMKRNAGELGQQLVLEAERL